VQQDAVEFLQLLLDRLETVTPDLCRRLFQGTLVHHIKGVAQPFSQQTTELFVNLPLEVKGQRSISDSLALFLVPDHFHDYDAAESGKIDVIRENRVSKAPLVLIVSLQRFQYTLRTQVREKLNTRFEFPATLDIAQITTTPDVPVVYELAGIVQHSGTALSGHYVSHVRVSDKTWVTFNDVAVTEVSASVIAQTFGGGDGGNAYVLFYRLQGCDFTSDAAIDDTVRARVEAGVRELILRKLHDSLAYTSLVVDCCDDGLFLLDLLFSAFAVPDSLTDVILRTCTASPEFAMTVLADRDRQLAVLMRAGETAVQAPYSRIIAAAIQSVDEATAADFLDSLFQASFASPERFATKPLLSPHAFRPFEVYFGSSRADDERWLARFTELLGYALQNRSCRSSGVSSVFGLVATLATRSPRQTSCLATICTPELITESVAMPGFAALLAVLPLNDLLDGVVRALAVKSPAAAEAFLDAVARFARARVVEAPRRWVRAFLLHDDVDVRKAACRLFSEAFAGASAAAFETTYDAMFAEFVRVRDARHPLDYRWCPKEFYDIFKAVVINGGLSGRFVDAASEIAKTLTAMRDAEPTINCLKAVFAIISAVECADGFFRPDVFAQFLGVLSRLTRAEFRPASDINIDIEFLQFVQKERVSVYFQSGYFRRLLSRHKAVTARAVRSALLEFVLGKWKGNEEAIGKQICDLLKNDTDRLTSDICQLCWRILRQDGEFANRFWQDGITDQIWQLQFAERPPMHSVIRAQFKLLARYNFAYCDVNKGRRDIWTLYLRTWNGWLENFWIQKTEQKWEPIIEFANQRIPNEKGSSGLWLFIESLAAIGQKLNRSIAAFLMNGKSYVVRCARQAQKSCASCLEKVFRREVDAGKGNRKQVMDFLMAEFCSIVDSPVADPCAVVLLANGVIQLTNTPQDFIPQVQKILEQPRTIRVFRPPFDQIAEAVEIHQLPDVNGWMRSALQLLPAEITELKKKTRCEMFDRKARDLMGCLRFIHAMESRGKVVVNWNEVLRSDEVAAIDQDGNAELTVRRWVLGHSATVGFGG
jgi:hypothetical protein